MWLRIFSVMTTTFVLVERDDDAIAPQDELYVEDHSGVAEATFVVRDAQGNAKEVAWSDGESIRGIGRFAVLDAACSQTYVRGGSL